MEEVSAKLFDVRAEGTSRRDAVGGVLITDLLSEASLSRHSLGFSGLGRLLARAGFMQRQVCCTALLLLRGHCERWSPPLGMQSLCCRCGFSPVCILHIMKSHSFQVNEGSVCE